MHGEDKDGESDEVDGRTSPPPSLASNQSSDMFDLDSLPLAMAKEKPPVTIVGDVGGRIAIMIDDVIDDVESFVATAEHLREAGAYKIYLLATHGFFSPDAPGLIEDSAIDEVIVTNTGQSFWSIVSFDSNCVFHLSFPHVCSASRAPEDEVP